MANIFDTLSDKDLIELDGKNLTEELRRRGYENGWHKKTEYAGVIYIFVNPAFPNLIKIGYADNAEKRAKALSSSSGVPDPYHIYATYKVKKRLEDLRLHNLIDSLNPGLRHAKNKEFYEITPEKAYNILSAIAQINGDEELLIKNPTNDQFFSAIEDLKAAAETVHTPNSALLSSRRPAFRFSMCNIPVGAVVKFVEDSTVQATVVDDVNVEYNGQIYSLTALTARVKRELGTSNPSGVYQGPKYWTYNGRRLRDIRDKHEKKGY